jgi:hypothetical protein
MAAGPKPTRSAKKKRRRTLREEIVDYVVEIDGWDWGYSFSLNSERQPIDPYHEFRHILVKGRLLTPAGLKTDRAEISLLPSTDLEEDRRKDLKPIALGSLSVTEDAILGNIGIPWDDAGPADADRRQVQVRADARYSVQTPHGPAEQPAARDQADRGRHGAGRPK